MTADNDYGDECVLTLANGNTIRTDTFADNPAGASYVRVCDASGDEVAHWSCDEWRDDPQLVMGAIFGAAAMGVATADDEDDEPATPLTRLRDYASTHPNVNGTDPEDVMAELLSDEWLTCSLTGAEGEDADDCTTHLHEYSGPQFLLVEENVRGGYWLSLFDSRAEAADYHYNQEYAGDWTIDVLVDLRTGDEFQEGAATHAITWEAKR